MRASDDTLRDRARKSLEEHGGYDQAVFDKFAALLHYVRGAYDVPDTYVKLRQALGEARRPLHYLAIPPSIFEVATEGLSKAGCAKDARVVVSVQHQWTPIGAMAAVWVRSNLDSVAFF